MTSPLAKGLFQKAIAESGSALNPNIPTLAVSEERGEKLAAMLKAPSGEGAIKFLRELTVGQLLMGLEARDPNEPPFLGPNIDGWVIARLPPSFASGQQMPIPLLIGSTTRELGMPGGAEEVRKMIQDVAGDLAPKVLSVYGLADGGTGTTDPCTERSAINGSRISFSAVQSRRRRSGTTRRSILPTNINSNTPFPVRKPKARCILPIYPMCSVIIENGEYLWKIRRYGTQARRSDRNLLDEFCETRKPQRRRTVQLAGI